MNIEIFLEIENAFDQNNFQLIKKLCENNNAPGTLLNFFELLNEKKYLEARKIGQILFLDIHSSTQNRELQGFVLQWIIACIEMNFDEQLRNRFILKWSLITGWAQSKWCLLLRKNQSALSMYFQSSYREALILFQQVSDDAALLNYERGEERAQFHIALIYRNMGLPIKAEESLARAKTIALKRNSLRMLERIEQLDIALQDKTWSLNQNIKKIESLMKQKEYKNARKLLLQVCRSRRSEKRSWGAESEVLYMALVSLAFKHQNRFLFLYHSLIDPIIKERTLSLSIELELELPTELTGELSYLRQTLGIQGFTQGKSSEVFGQRLTKINDPVVIKFLKLITENEIGCDKENLCKQLWNYDYDPVIHDPKIYKLIFKTKKILGTKDAILAAGGFYRMNQKYCY